VLTLLLAMLVGLSLGLLGAGGSVLAVPILRYVAGLSAKQAVATSLATVGAISLVGGLLAWKEGRLRWRQALEFALIASLGTFLGVQLASGLSDKVQMGLFLLVMAGALVVMRRPRRLAPSSGGQAWYVLWGQALAVGVLTGVVGVGGGFLIVPALVAIYSLPIKDATGTSLAVIAFNSLVGMVSYSQALELDWRFTLEFVAAALAGLLGGLAIGRKVESRTTEQAFLAVLVAVGLYTAIHELFF
jgi:uncharacterized membrane protein YfcA